MIAMMGKKMPMGKKKNMPHKDMPMQKGKPKSPKKKK